MSDYEVTLVNDNSRFYQTFQFYFRMRLICLQCNPHSGKFPHPHYSCDLGKNFTFALRALKKVCVLAFILARRNLYRGKRLGNYRQ